MTRVRLPDTPVPELKAKVQKLDGKVDELVGLLVSRNDGDVVLKQAQALLHRCAAVIAVDQGRTDDTVSLCQVVGKGSHQRALILCSEDVVGSTAAEAGIPAEALAAVELPALRTMFCVSMTSMSRFMRLPFFANW